MKVPLADQIALATRLRDQAEALGPKTDADTLNGIVLTLSLIQATEAEFRQFMKSRKDAA